jgi:hypothetical protein
MIIHLFIIIQIINTFIYYNPDYKLNFLIKYSKLMDLPKQQDHTVLSNLLYDDIKYPLKCL